MKYLRYRVSQISDEINDEWMSEWVQWMICTMSVHSFLGAFAKKMRRATVSFFMSLCLSVRLSLCLSVRLSVCLSVRLSVCLTVRFSLCLSVRLSVCMSVLMEQLGSHWTGFHEICYWSVFTNSVETVQDPLKSDKNSGYLTWRPICIYDNISLNSSQNEYFLRQKL